VLLLLLFRKQAIPLTTIQRSSPPDGPFRNASVWLAATYELEELVPRTFIGTVFGDEKASGRTDHFELERVLVSRSEYHLLQQLLRYCRTGTRYLYALDIDAVVFERIAISDHDTTRRKASHRSKATATQSAGRRQTT
jgi:hypothetical protein